MVTTPVCSVHRVSYSDMTRPRLVVVDQLILASPSQGHATITHCTPPTTQQLPAPEGRGREKSQDGGEQEGAEVTTTSTSPQPPVTTDDASFKATTEQTVTPGQEGAEKTTSSTSPEPPVTTDDASLNVTTEGSSVGGGVEVFPRGQVMLIVTPLSQTWVQFYLSRG